MQHVILQSFFVSSVLLNCSLNVLPFLCPSSVGVLFDDPSVQKPICAWLAISKWGGSGVK